MEAESFMPRSRARIAAILCLLRAGCAVRMAATRPMVCQGTGDVLLRLGARERSSRPSGPFSICLLTHLYRVLLEIPNLRQVTLAFLCFLQCPSQVSLALASFERSTVLVILNILR